MDDFKAFEENSDNKSLFNLISYLFSLVPDKQLRVSSTEDQ